MNRIYSNIGLSKQSNYFIVFFVLIALSFSLKLNAQTKIGSLNYKTVIESIPMYHTWKKENELIGLELEDSLHIFQNRYNDFIMKGGCGPISNIELEFKQNKIDSLQNQLFSFYMNSKSKIESLEENLQLKIETIINAELAIFCKIHHLDYLFKQDILNYCSNCKDYTEDFIKFINKDY